DPWYGDTASFNERYHDPAHYIYGIRIYRGSTPTAGGASPHGFAKGDATWWADWEAHWNGWELAFPTNAPRDPWQWYEQVLGADHLGQPKAGAIAVFQTAQN